MHVFPEHYCRSFEDVLDSKYQVATIRSSFYETILKSSKGDTSLGRIYDTMRDEPRWRKRTFFRLNY